MLGTSIPLTDNDVRIMLLSECGNFYVKEVLSFFNLSQMIYLQTELTKVNTHSSCLKGIEVYKLVKFIKDSFYL